MLQRARDSQRLADPVTVRKAAARTAREVLARGVLQRARDSQRLADPVTVRKAAAKI